MKLAIVSLAAAAAVAAQGTALVQRLDTIAGAGVLENRAVGIVAAVARGNDTLLLKAYGKADVEGNVPMTNDTVLPIGSVTKQFTAAAILQLRDQGKLGLDDEITKWLPDFNMRGNNVTLRHLLGHTSGIAELVEMAELRAMKIMRNPAVTAGDIYQVVNRQPFQFPTGTIQVYSNTNYWLLGLVLEKASGMTYEDYMKKHMFEPLRMTGSMSCGDAEKIPGRAANGYGMKGGMTIRVPPIVHTATHAAGALCSTARDMVTWMQALHGGKVVTPRSYSDIVTPTTLSDGTSTRYSLGTTVAEDANGLRYLGHNGGGFGFSSEARWYPGASLAVVVLTNSEPDEITKVAESLVAEVLPPPRPAGPFKGDGSLLAGTYKGPGPGGENVVEVTQTPAGISFNIRGNAVGVLPWVEGLTFRRGSSLLTFRRSGNRGPATALVIDTGGDHFILKRQ